MHCTVLEVEVLGIHILNIEIMTKNTKLKIDSKEYINSSSNTRHTERDGIDSEGMAEKHFSGVTAVLNQNK